MISAIAMVVPVISVNALHKELSYRREVGFASTYVLISLV